MKMIRLLLKNSWQTVILAAGTGLLSGVSSAGLIALINLTLRGDQYPPTLLAGTFAGLCLLLLISTAAAQILIARLAQEVIFKLRMRLSEGILACPLRHLEAIGTPQLLATLTEDIEVISIASISVATLFVNAAILLACLLYLSWLSVPVFLLIFGCMVLGILSHGLLANQGGHFFQLSREIQDQLFQHFRTTTEGTKELKLHYERRQAFLQDDLKPAAASSQRYRVAGMTIFAIAGSWGVLLFFVAIGILVFGLPLLTPISVSVLSGYALTIIFMITPLWSILNSLPELARANIALDKIESLGLSLAAQEVESLTIPVQANLSWKALKLVGVTHTYQGEREGDRFILGPINLIFYPGELVFIVGGNGSGKSTLIKLITGLYIPEAGVIQLDEQPITDINRESYRQQFSAVFADFYLFERLLGLNHSLDSRTQLYLEKLQLTHKVKVENGVLSTTALSQGQRKRLALLTAYLEDRPIYVFDEWASDQDPVFKEVFYTQLLPELKAKGKTVLVISHDDRYFTVADRIVKLDYGNIESDQRLHQP